MTKLSQLALTRHFFFSGFALFSLDLDGWACSVGLASLAGSVGLAGLGCLACLAGLAGLACLACSACLAFGKVGS